MACLNTLKQEIKTLESVFPKSHERFQIMSASVDELSCRFVGKNGKKYEIHANITVSVTRARTPCARSWTLRFTSCYVLCVAWMSECVREYVRTFIRCLLLFRSSRFRHGYSPEFCYKWSMDEILVLCREQDTSRPILQLPRLFRLSRSSSTPIDFFLVFYPSRTRELSSNKKIEVCPFGQRSICCFEISQALFFFFTLMCRRQRWREENPDKESRTISKNVESQSIIRSRI